jgi:hypothetical protein
VGSESGTDSNGIYSSLERKITLSRRPCLEKSWKNRRSQVAKGILNPLKATERAVLLENLVQEGHKVENQNVLVTSTIEEDVSSAL